MPKKLLTHLWKSLDFRPNEILRADLYLGIAAGGGAAALAVVTPDALLRSVAVAAGLIGVIIGSVIAGVAIQTAFMDQSFLRKLRAINRNPVRYVSPFLFTAVLSVLAMLGLVVLSTLSAKSPVAVLAVIGGLTGFFAIWSIVSLLYCLATLVQFMGLKVEALDVPDDAAGIEAARKSLRQVELRQQAEALLRQLEEEE
jgi:hypothetical protein